MKKTLSILCASAMAVSLTACGTTQTDTTPDYAYATVTGQVTAIDGNSVTLQLGTLSAASGDSQTPPDAAQGDSTSDNSTDTQTAPEKPDGDSSSDSSSDTQTPPEKPDGDSSSDSSSDTQTPPEKSDGDSSSDTSDSDSGDSTQPEMPSGNSGDMGSAPGGMGGGQSFTSGDVSITVDLSDATITTNSDSATVSDLSTDDVVTLTFDGTGAVTAAEVVNLDGGMGDAPGGMGGGGSTVEQGDSANTISEDSTVSDTTYTSTGDDENALRVDGATVTLSGITVDKSAGASSNVESGDFYGMNAALLATNGATLTIEDATITSSAQNGNGVFSYGTGTTVNISNSTITTTADNSGGIQTTGGGTTNATNLTVDTSGNSAAAIRSDRGGGTVNVNEGTYTSNGYNSPAVYSTAAITVKNATLTANNSEALVIEGQNSITLENCDVTGNMSDTNGTSSDENVHNVMIYQSMSGDAEVGTSSFSMTGGTLTSKNGDMFFITNTDCTLYLSGVSITNEDSDGNLMTITGNSASRGWGTAGKNGAQVNFTADNQVLSGNIVVDTISTLDMTLTNGSDFTGTINITDNDEGGTAVDNNAVVTIDSGCTWTLTGDCTITSLTNNGTINFNGYTITLADGTVLS
jgi:hypothetical protein